MADTLDAVLGRWCDAVGVDRAALPAPEEIRGRFSPRKGRGPCRPGAPAEAIDSWEHRHGFGLPRALRAWLLLSDGLYAPSGPLIHPLTAIGPMIPFARVPDLVVQPESWFELGNPGRETICIDLAYRWPGGDCPIFTSGDDLRHSQPRVIAPGFTSWVVRLFQERGRPYWFAPGFPSLGDPWKEHRHRTPAPPLPERLATKVGEAQSLMRTGLDDRAAARQLGVTPGDVEILFRHLQHGPSYRAAGPRA